MLQMNESELKSLIEGGLKQTQKGFAFNPSQKLLTQQTKTAHMSSLLADQVETSIYIQNSNSDFKVIMCSPYIEYNIPGYNFSFVKHLSRDEIQSFISSNF